MEELFTETASLLAEPARAKMLLKLLDGKALPAGELAAAANIAPQTASGHLAKLIGARMLEVESQGRHRYYRLAGTDVADALEAILVLLPRSRSEKERSDVPPAGTLAHARTCYSHLAGWLGVRVTDGLQSQGFLLAAPGKRFHVTERGYGWFLSIGIAIEGEGEHSSSRFARQCLDWTERRPHLSGTLGVMMYRRFIELKWLTPAKRTRIVYATLLGRQELWKHLRVPLG